MFPINCFSIDPYTQISIESKNTFVQFLPGNSEQGCEQVIHCTVRTYFALHSFLHQQNYQNCIVESQFDFISSLFCILFPMSAHFDVHLQIKKKTV